MMIRNKKLEEKLRQILEQAVEENLVAGGNLLVWEDGKELVYTQAGLADRENNKKINRDTIFRLYSMSKPVTAAAAMILMERGMLDLYEPVSKFLPEYAEVKVAAENGLISPQREILVGDLLSMTSGLVYPDEATVSGKTTDLVYQELDRRLYSENPMTTRELAKNLANCPLAFTPGSSWQYGTSADVLAAVIEVISERKFSEFLDEEIFMPLGMRDTGFWVPEEKQDRLAKTYETVVLPDGRNDMVLYTGNHLGIRNDMMQSPAYEAGGAGLVSTLDDYMKFAGMLLGEGFFDGVRILQPETVRYMCSRELMPAQQAAMDAWIGLEGHSYGNFMRVCKDPTKSKMLVRRDEYGWDGWLGMYFANFPNEKMTMLIGTQKKDGGTFALTRKLRNAILSAIEYAK